MLMEPHKWLGYGMFLSCDDKYGLYGDGFRKLEQLGLLELLLIFGNDHDGLCGDDPCGDDLYDDGLYLCGGPCLCDDGLYHDDDLYPYLLIYASAWMNLNSSETFYHLHHRRHCFLRYN